MTNLFERIQKQFLPNVSKPLRYTGSELNVVRKNLSEISVHGCCCFPDLYDIGMSHHGLQILYHIVNANPAWALSRCFTPWTDAERVMREAGLPLFTLEYCTPVKTADWIGFSVQYELQYSNLVNMLDLAGLSVLSSQRKEDDPPVIAGGPCMANPEPLAPFVDAFLIGDGEEAVSRFCTVIEKYKGEGRSRILEQAARIPGFYVPSNYAFSSKGKFVVPEISGDGLAAHTRADSNCASNSNCVPVKPARIAEFKAEYLPSAPLVPLMDVVHHRLAVEVMRGCTRGCRFCGAGMYYRPVREKEIMLIRKQTEQGVQATGWRDVGLLSLSTADYSQFTPLLGSMRALKELSHLKMSIPSTRIDALTCGQLDALNSVSPVTSFTIAPEAGSQRLRRVINKDFTDETIFDTVRLLLNRNVHTLKLYFMVGLPTEKREDIQAVIDMVKTISSMMRAALPGSNLHVAISPFSPKANTPFQWEGMENMETVEEKGRFIKRCLRDKKNVKVSYRGSSMAFLETVMARGDRRVGELILEAWKAGARFDGWDELFKLELWVCAAQRLGIDLNLYTECIDANENLPWRAVSAGVDVEFLLRERALALEEKSTPDCKRGPCGNCGACGGPVSTRLCAHQEREQPQAADTAVTYGRRHASVSQKQPTSYYRFIYEKKEQVRFLGHLDMVEVFRRAMTAANFPLVFSHGFNPHPRISFGPPLPFSATGLAEAFDIETSVPLQGDPLELNRWLPEGLEVKGCLKMDRPRASLNSVIRACHYRIYPPRKFSPQQMLNMLDTVNAQSEIIIQREKKGVITYKNIRPAIISTDLGDTDGTAYWAAVLSLAPGASCKPSEFISALCPGEDFSGFLVCREKFFIE
ncbi:MAG: TIGR03960 family B12-binding radical SAM protein [Chitinispirillales bacterium]|jgi:radical SAM family uncharacterized protein/radical SAM-linked protein|nr:TIGR03960 family B12-binding radical SAM protein [Chitinispirillales bacterium]